MKLPDALTIELNLPYPRFVCQVTDGKGKGTAHGGFLKRFGSHAAMWAWLAKHNYTLPGALLK